MIKFNYIQEYVTLCETLNFSRAAQLCFITQPALSRHIASLEEEMGAKLLTRDTRNVVLTDAGKAVYERFCQILSNYRAACSEASALSSGKAGLLRIGSPYYWTEDYNEPLMNRFMDSHENCNIQLYSCQPADGYEALKSGKTDLLLATCIPDLKPDIRVFDFAGEKLTAMVSADHPFAALSSIKPEQINGDAMIFINEEIYRSSSDALLNLLISRGAKPGERIYSQQVDTLAYTVKKTNGVALVPYGVRHMDRSGISFVPIEGDDFVLPMSFYYRYDNENPLIPQFLKCAAEVFGNK